MDVIQVNELTKYYGKSRGIENLSFSVKEGEIFGFIGPNGAGKSTTIRLLLSLIHPTSGQASVFGKDVTKEGPEIRSQVGYLPSEVFYYDHMKVGDLLIVFKAMKMNNNIKATFAGKVKKIDVKEGDNIPNHALMIEME